MFQKILIASAATVLATATFATSASAATSNPSRKAAGETRFCISYHPVVGSRIGRVDCMTRTEWAREGVNVDKVMRG